MAFENMTNPLENVTAPPVELTSITGIITLIIGLVLVVVAAYIVYKVLKNLIANAIIGGIGLIVLHFLFPMLFKIEVPITILNILICVIAGLPGLVIVVLLAVFGVG